MAPTQAVASFSTQQLGSRQQTAANSDNAMLLNNMFMGMQTPSLPWRKQSNGLEIMAPWQRVDYPRPSFGMGVMSMEEMYFWQHQASVHSRLSKANDAPVPSSTHIQSSSSCRPHGAAAQGASASMTSQPPAGGSKRMQTHGTRSFKRTLKRLEKFPSGTAFRVSRVEKLGDNHEEKLRDFFERFGAVRKMYSVACDTPEGKHCGFTGITFVVMWAAAAAAQATSSEEVLVEGVPLSVRSFLPRKEELLVTGQVYSL